jgi:outer membrane protein assembly factor BamB
VRRTDSEETLWDFSVHPEEGAVEDGMVCGAGAPELHSGSQGSNLLVRGDQVLFGYMCADPADFDHEWEAREQLDAYDERFDARLISFDLRTGEENWRRAWPDVPGAMNRLLLSDGGPVLREGADPVITVEGVGDGRFVVLNAADGSDLLDLGKEDTTWLREGGWWSVLRADSGGAVVSASAERHISHMDYFEAYSPNRVERGFCGVRLRDPALLFIQGRERPISPALYGVQSTI